MKYKTIFTMFGLILACTLLTSCDLTDMRDVGNRDHWWKYTRIGSGFADDLVGLSSVALIATITVLVMYGSFSHFFLRKENWERFSFNYPILIGAIGFGIIRGLFQHWAWWIIRWDEADIVRDFFAGTFLFFIAGCLGGIIICIAVTLAVTIISYTFFYPTLWVVTFVRSLRPGK